MKKFALVAWLLTTCGALSAMGGDERSNDPDPQKGTKNKNGYTACAFVTRAIDKDGKAVDVPYDADYWLPPEYAAEPTRRFPVVYVLQNMDIARNQMVEMSKKGQFPPYIVVHTMGITKPLNRGENGVWSESQGPSGKIFRNELIGWVDKRFRTIPGSKGRVLVGCSKAGGAVVHLGMHYPDLFSAAVSADGAIGLYDTGNNDADYYRKNKMTLMDAIQRNCDAAKDLPVLLLLGGMFGGGGVEDKYLKSLQSAGMRDLEYQDCRHFGHDCGGMTVDRFPEVMATFYNGIGDFAPWRPTVSHRGGLFAGAFDVTITLPKTGWTIRFTLDGSDPHKGGRTSSGSIHISETSCLRVIGISPDGKQQSRETLLRYVIQAPLPAIEAGTKPGLELRAYDKTHQHYMDVVVRPIAKGELKPSLENVTVARPGESGVVADQILGKSVFYIGSMSVPETRVYDFELLYGAFWPSDFKALGQPLVEGQGPISAFSLSLSKGAHPLVILCVPVKGRETSLSVRGADGKFAPVPEDWYRH